MRMWDTSRWVGACGVRAGHVIRLEGILAIVLANRGNVLQVMDELGREEPCFPTGIIEVCGNVSPYELNALICLTREQLYHAKTRINQEAVRQLLILGCITAEPDKPVKEERTRSIVLTGGTK